MKKLLTLCLLAVMCVAIGDMLAPQEAYALDPLACDRANELGWRNYGWNLICVWFLQMEGYTFNGDSWSAVTPSSEQQLEHILVDEKTYAMTTTVSWRAIRYPLRA